MLFLFSFVHYCSPPVLSRQSKFGCFLLEGLNSFATVYYLYYIYFLMRREFHFGNEANLLLAAWTGAVTMISSWLGGKMAQKCGYFFTLKTGFAVMALSLAVGSFFWSAAGQIIVMTVMVIGMCLTWPTLEAMVSEGESPEGTQHVIGIYNIVWAGTGALSYFLGGALIDRLGFKSTLVAPAVMEAIMLAFTFWLQRQSEQASHATPLEGKPAVTARPGKPPAKGKAFLQMAWLTNPFAYIAINTTIAVLPAVASRFKLSTTQAGFYCSLWCFARLFGFVVLWHWNGWHYRFRWLLLAYLALLAGFVSILMATTLTLLITAQVFFGASLALIYASSLFYSMDLSDTKGVHGGLHEAAIGLGNFAGPAVGAASLHFFPQYANSGAFAVGVLLLVGLGGLISIRTATHSGRTPPQPP
jgi:predicted MFS family arabinose efflux permease